MKTLSKMLKNYAEVNRKIGFYGYDGDVFSSKKIKNLEEQAEKLKFEILRCIYEGEEGDDLNEIRSRSSKTSI